MGNESKENGPSAGVGFAASLTAMFGVACLFYGAWALVLSMQLRENLERPQWRALRDMLDSMPGYYVMQYGKLSVAFIGAFLIISGSGVYRGQPGARLFTQVYGLGSALFHLAYIIYEMAAVMPVVSSLSGTTSEQNAAPTIGLLLAGGFFIVGGLVLSNLMRSEAVVAACGGAASVKVAERPRDVVNSRTMRGTTVGGSQPSSDNGWCNKYASHEVRTSPVR